MKLIIACPDSVNDAACAALCREPVPSGKAAAQALAMFNLYYLYSNTSSVFVNMQQGY